MAVRAHRIRHRVGFAETDMAGIAHFANFFRWMELAEADLFRARGLELFAAGPDGSGAGYPRVEAWAKFLAPVTFGDEVEVALTVEKLRESAVTYRFEFSKVLEDKLEGVAEGGFTTVFARRGAKEGTLRAAPLSQDVRQALEALQKGS